MILSPLHDNTFKARWRKFAIKTVMIAFKCISLVKLAGAVSSPTDYVTNPMVMSP